MPPPCHPAGAVTTAGHPAPPTPAQATIAWLGEQGVTFGHGFAATPLCAPSRASILTGQYAHNHGVRTNGLQENLNHDKTVQRYLQDAGYRTGLYGKFINGWDIFDSPPHFDEFGLLAPIDYQDGQFNIDGVPYAPSIEVPFYLSWPAGGKGAGVVDNRLVANVDIAPTILDAANVVPDPGHRSTGTHCCPATAAATRSPSSSRPAPAAKDRRPGRRTSRPASSTPSTTT